MAFGAFGRALRGLFAAPQPGSLDERIQLPAHVAYAHAGPRPPADRLEWDLTIQADPGSVVGEYLALFNGSIDGSQCYLGLQTDVRNPDLGRGVGKGLIFSTWWSFDAADIHVAPGGFREMGTHEGRFIGVRQSYPWTVGDFRVSLGRAGFDEIDGKLLDWFELTITPTGPQVPGAGRPVATGSAELIGALRFPRRRGDRPAQVDPGGVAFLEVYGAAATWADVARWEVDVAAFADGHRITSGRTEYPSFPHDQVMPNVNIRYDRERDRVALSMGVGVERRDPAGPWP